MSFGLSVDRLKLLHRAWRYRLRLDKREIRFLIAHLHKGDVAVDIGAHKGAYTYWMQKRVGRKGRVFAFEPQPDLAAYLRRALISPRRPSNVVIENIGLSSTPGELTLYVPGAAPSPGASFELRGDAPQTAYTVRVDTLDNYFREHANLTPHHKIAFIKCDVEGHELEVFRGGESVLRTHRPTLLFECEQRHHPRDSIADVFSYIRQMDYTGFFFDGQGMSNISAFDPARHQRDPRTNYVNNFLFLPAAR